ncbi:NAD(P)H-dependent oxidoreductase [Lacisediminihabitans sp.]|uniref:NADPH-dependent FMN reductase n=1 Tax=Lacisediminihabitans sp. TaxID=2787631 RepID=UPI002F94A7B5
MSTKIGIIIGSTRPGRNGGAIARWVNTIASKRTDAEFEVVDLLDYNLPHLDEAVPASRGQYANDHTKAWAEKIAEFDGYIFVTPEYNHSTSGVLKNAIDYLYAEWNNKSAGFVSYGGSGGSRAVEHLRLVVAELQIADVRAQLGLSLVSDFENYTTFIPTARHEAHLDSVLEQTVAWAGALKPLRETARELSAA